ncbi:MAG TPA: T9SS type A sorting domain-containing protein, partial [Bacteroidia bacterium]|nr:T9SS type A sorting domain-containing protein [Bacteroidia bacterium]
TQTVTVNSPGTYWVEVAGGSACAPRDSITVTQSPNALTVNLGPDLTACEGQTVTFDAGPGYTSYTWQDGSTLPTYTAWLPGNYWVSVTDGQCNGMASDTVALVSSGLLQVGLGNDTVLCAGGSFVLQAPVGFSGYLWQDGSTASNFTVTLPGTYWVQVTDAQGCLGMDTLVVSPCTGMSAGGAGMDLQVWPNPAAGELHFDIIGLPTGESVAVGLWDMAGRELLHLHGAGHPGTLDLRMLPKGLYCLRVTVGEVVFVEKVAVE